MYVCVECVCVVCVVYKFYYKNNAVDCGIIFIINRGAKQ